MIGEDARRHAQRSDAYGRDFSCLGTGGRKNVAMRIVFCGSGDFGIPTLRALVSSSHQVTGVYTQPPRPAGRGGKERPTPVSEASGGLGLPVWAVQDINDPACVEAIRQSHPDIVLVVDFGQKIGPEICAAAVHGAVNLHGSLLPELRGAGPVNWAIIRGYVETGVTTFRIVEKMDAGVMFVRRATPIRPDETAEELRHRLSELGCEAVLETLGELAAGWSGGQEQDPAKATKAPRLKKTDGVIHWTADAVSIRNRIHGTWPWPGAQAEFVCPSGKKVPVLIARAAVQEDLLGPATSSSPPGGEPGSLGKDLSVATGKGRLVIRQIKPAGGRLMNWQDFVNGHRVSPGASFLAGAL